MPTSIISGVEELARRRGFFWQSSEIYGGISGLYDYGHLGTLLKRKFENQWRNYFIEEGYYEIEATDIMPENVFRASGHLQNFVDPIVKCKKCGNKERADHIIEDELKENFEGLAPEELTKLIKKHNIKCPKCKGGLESVETLNMMFSVDIGVGQGNKAYMRPETAQGCYVNFKRAFEHLRKKLPLGLAIVGKAYRNEISPRNILLRMREFTQAELQIFFDPDTITEHEDFDSVKNYKLRLFPVKNRANNKIEEITCAEAIKIGLPKFYVYHMAKIQKFYLDFLKLPKDILRFKELSEEERAFYNKYHWDIELLIPEIGWKEVAGIHYRTDHDLGGHQKISKKDLSVTIEGKKILPHVLELSFGVDRNIFAMLALGYKEDKDRIVLKLPRMLSPFYAAVFPLVNKDNIPEKAEQVKELLKNNFLVFYDDSGSIGRRYRRTDEIGVALGITIDHQTLEDDTVTLRDRDSMKQVRVKVADLNNVIFRYLHGEDVENLGK